MSVIEAAEKWKMHCILSLRQFVSQWSVERPSPILIQMMIAQMRDAGVLYGVIDWCLLMSFI